MLVVAVVFHVAASLILVMLVLLHAGRGGGLSEMFGGGMGGGLSGSSVMEKNLDRLTIIVASFFTITTLALAFLMK
ncbi:MAG: preprotein translocase subunit SecG [Actinomycetota bacterium]